jgi:hypothetical protein
MDKGLLIITSVTNETTPILNSFKKYFIIRNYSIEEVIYHHKRRISFVIRSLKAILVNNKKTSILFIGIQTLPIIFISNFFSFHKYYWALESYEFRFLNSSLAEKTLLFEKLIFWNKINLITPSEYRNDFFKRKYNQRFILENSPMLGNVFKKRVIINKIIKFILYGRLSNHDVYIEEFINIAKTNKNQMELHLAGWEIDPTLIPPDSKNIYYYGPLSHQSLMDLMDRMNVSIVGYRPYKYNNKFCAPNKLYESLSKSLPVIVSSQNPPLKEIVTKYQCGMVANFENLDNDIDNIIKELIEKYDFLCISAFSAYINKYNFEYSISKTFQSINNSYEV